MKQKLTKIVIGLVVLALIYIGYQKFVVAPQAAKKLVTTTVKRGDLSETLIVSGKILADQDAILRFQSSGLLTWVGVKEGDYIKKYQGIASLDQRTIRKNLDKELQSYLKTRWSFENTKDASGDPAAMTTAVRRAFESAQFDLNSSVLDVELQDLAVQFSSLWTPIEGLVVRAESPLPGVNITPAQAEFEVINPQSVYFSATADQTEVTKLTASQSGILRLDAFPDQEITGHLDHISFTPDTSETGTVYDVKFVFSKNNSNYNYRLGMTGDLTFITQQKVAVLYLPTKFIKSDASGKYVNLLSNSQAVKTKVTTGLETDADIEITSGISEGNIVSD